MKRFIINSRQDLLTIKKINRAFDEITINLDVIKQRGLIRHAVKYSINALQINGRMIINTTPFVAYYFRKNAIDYWQVKYEVLNSLRDAIEIEESVPEQGKLILIKKKHLYDYDGISFGIVFSGSENEEIQLIQQVDSIVENERYNKVPSEVNICGPSTYNPSKLLKHFENQNVNYFPFDIPTAPRLMICEKKNYLYIKGNYSIIVIAHTRILFSKNFIGELYQYPIEMGTSSIFFKKGDREYKYLDFGFLNSYQDIQLGTNKLPVAGENVDTESLHWFKNRVPYIDGGLNIFNKNIILHPPYNQYIAWGEAEDVDICNRLFQEGVLIDYLPDIKCFSVTNKLKGYNKLKKVGRKIFEFLNK